MSDNNCKNCIHLEVCEEYQKLLSSHIEDYDLNKIARDCNHFKHKLRFIDNGTHKVVKRSFL